MSVTLTEQTSAAWKTGNTTLGAGAIGQETDTFKIKIGDGATAWNSLAYVVDDNRYEQLVGLAVTAQAIQATSVSSGGAATVSSLTVNGNAAVTGTETVFSTDKSQNLQIYHTGTFGQIESSTGFVLLSDSGQTTLTGSNSTQARVQHSGGSFREMNFGHDDTKGTIATNSGNIVIAPNSAATQVTGSLAISGTVGFNGTTPPAKPTVTGAKGSNAALGSLMTALAALGLVTDTTSA